MAARGKLRPSHLSSLYLYQCLYILTRILWKNLRLWTPPLLPRRFGYKKSLSFQSSILWVWRMKALSISSTKCWDRDRLPPAPHAAPIHPSIACKCFGGLPVNINFNININFNRHCQQDIPKVWIFVTSVSYSGFCLFGLCWKSLKLYTRYEVSNLKVYRIKCLLCFYTLLCLQHVLKAENDNFSEGIDHREQHPDLDQLDVRGAW